MELAFWIVLAFVFHTYFFYPLLLWPLSRWKFRRRPQEKNASAYRPSVSMVVAAYNEEQVIAAKIADFLQTRYEGDLELLIGSDASTDATAALARQCAAAESNIRVYDFAERGGKTGVINRLAPEARGEILIFSDANTLYDEEAVARLVARFSDPEIGGACGKLELVRQGRKGCWEEGLYWWYENAIKTLEARTGTLTSLNGQVLAIRKELFRPLPASALVDDLLIGMRVLTAGYKLTFVPEARVRESVSLFEEEFRRRVRISMGNFQTLFFVPQLLNPLYGWSAFSFWSHKVLRWLVPFLLVALFVLNAFLLDETFYRTLLAAQLAFYALGLLGFFSSALRRWRLFSLIHYFTAMNLALLVGFFRLLRHRSPRGWESTQRL